MINMLEHSNLKIKGFNQVYQPYHTHQPNQMHVHSIMHDLPYLSYNITTSMHDHIQKHVYGI